MIIRPIATFFTALALFCAFSAVGMAKSEYSALDKRIGQLPPEKRDAARTILKQFTNTNAGLKEAVKAKKDEIDALMKEAHPDKERLVTLGKELGELRGKELVSRVELRENFRKAGIEGLRFEGDDSRENQSEKRDAKRGRERGQEQRVVKLTAEQWATAKKIVNQSRAIIAANQKALTSKISELHAQMRSQTPDLARIRKLSLDIGELRGKDLSAKVELRQNLEEAGIPIEVLAAAIKNNRQRDFKK